MRVVLVARGFADYLLSLAQQLTSFVELHIAVGDRDRWLVGELPPSVGVIDTGAPRVASPMNLAALTRLARAIRKLRPDIVHYQSGVIWESLAPRLGTSTRVVTTVHDVTNHPHDHFFRFTPQVFGDRLALKSDALIVHGAALAQLASNRYGQLAAKIPEVHVVPHPVISRYGSGAARVGAGTNVLLFGTLDRWKGIERLLPAFEIVSALIPACRLRIAGASASPDYYRNLPYKYTNVDWHIGYQSADDVRAHFRWADLLVLPYIEASQSGVRHLAMSFGLPAVVTDVGALSEGVSGERGGLVVETHAPESLAAAIVRMLTDVELRRRVVANIVADRTKELAEHSTGRRTADVYQRVCGLR